MVRGDAIHFGDGLHQRAKVPELVAISQVHVFMYRFERHSRRAIGILIATESNHVIGARNVHGQRVAHELHAWCQRCLRYPGNQASRGDSGTAEKDLPSCEVGHSFSPVLVISFVGDSLSAQTH